MCDILCLHTYLNCWMLVNVCFCVAKQSIFCVYRCCLVINATSFRVKNILLVVSALITFTLEASWCRPLWFLSEVFYSVEHKYFRLLINC